jgi:hypothetical protein
MIRLMIEHDAKVPASLSGSMPVLLHNCNSGAMVD